MSPRYRPYQASDNIIVTGNLNGITIRALYYGCMEYDVVKALTWDELAALRQASTTPITTAAANEETQ